MELNEASLLWLEKLAEGVDANKPIFVMTHQAFNCSHWRHTYMADLDRKMKD